MKKLSLLTLLLAINLSGFAQHSCSLQGDWKEAITIQGNPLPITTHFTGDDSLSGTIDIPQQGATGLPLQKISASTDSVFFEFQAGPGLAKFKGAFQSDSTITGSFHQNGLQFPFELSRTKSEIETKKQTASAPLPYNHEDLIIKNDSIAIGGTLTWPKDEKANNLVIMISGSGAQNRDANLQPVTDFKPFATLADSLTAAGIATFRYDDRGLGQSTGNFDDATLDILASDVEAIIERLSTRDGHNFEEIILLGHSQGGVVGGKAAAENDKVDKLILMASTGVPLKEVLRFQVRQAFKVAPVDSQLIEKEISARENLMEAVRNNEGIDEARKQYQSRFKEVQVAAGADSAQASAVAQNQARQLTSVFQSPQTQSLLFYDPATDLSKLDIPVLVLFGGKDTQVTVEMNQEPIGKALESTGVKYQTEIFTDANHLFQKAETGQVQEYGTLHSQFIDGFLSTIEQWIKK